LAAESGKEKGKKNEAKGLFNERREKRFWPPWWELE